MPGDAAGRGGIAAELAAEIQEGGVTLLRLHTGLYAALAAAGVLAALGWTGFMISRTAGGRLALCAAAGGLIHGALWRRERRRPSPTSWAFAANVGNALLATASVWWTGIRPLSYLLVFNTFMTSFLYRDALCLVSGGSAIALLGILTARFGLGDVEDLAVFGWLAVVTVSALVIARTLRQQAGRILTHSREKVALQEAFSRFTGDFLTRRASQGGIAHEGEKREVTVMFTDLRDFTALSENLPPHDLVRLLNEHFQMSVEVITANGGYVNKFIGDAVMAVFGAPERNPWHCLDAVKAALALRKAVAEANARRAAAGQPAIRMGIGLHGGEVIAGVIGSRARAEFTVIGDTVNVASRLESMTKERKVDLLISEPVARALDASFGARELEPAQVRGRVEPVRVYTIDNAALKE